MIKQKTCPDCGVAAGQPHIKECDVEVCSCCNRQRITCGCGGRHNPMKSLWTGEWPFQNPEPDRHKMNITETEGFVLYGPGETSLKKEVTSSVEQNSFSTPEYSDSLLSRNARLVFKSGFIEPIYHEGKLTGQFVSCRRGERGCFELAPFSNRNDALNWLKKTNNHNGSIESQAQCIANNTSNNNK